MGWYLEVIQDSFTTEELNHLLPSALRPVEKLRSALYQATYPFAIRRLSAFPRFAASQSEVMGLLRSARGKEDGYREAFCRLCKNMAAETACFVNQRRYKPRDVGYTKLDLAKITHDLAIGLTEEDAVDIVLPELKVVLVGHDDFGCNVLASHDNPSAFPWVERHARKAGVHLLELPASSTPDRA